MGEQRPCKTAPIAATGQAVVGGGKLGHVLVTPGSDATTVTVYDSANATLTDKVQLFKGVFVANAKTEGFPYVPALAYASGLYIAITGTAVSVILSTY